MKEINKEVVRKYKDGEIGCAEAMVLGVYNIVEKEVEPTIYKDTLTLSKPFIKGIAGLQESCGCITGFTMALSLYTDSNTKEYRSKVKELADYQNELKGSNQCLDLIGEFGEGASDTEERNKFCTGMLMEMLEKSEEILKDI